jgi:hypothetical protein
MGRHSAPETDEELPEPESAASAAHQSAVSSAVSTVSSAVSSTASSAASAAAASAASSASSVASGARGDLQLLRTDTGLMLRCAGALVLIFLIFTSVLILLGRTDVYLIWFWIPTVLSGIAIGGLLDRAHRRLSDPDRSAS